VTTESPFARPEVVGPYEDWYATPFGRVADRVERALIVDLLRPLSPPATLLDLGCGTGHFATALRDLGFRVVGADPEPAMLAVARARVPVVRAEGARLPFDDRAFDAVVIVTVLEFAADPVALLREARRVARERVVVLALASDSFLGLRRRVAGWLGHPVFARATLRGRRALVALARRAGAEPLERRSALFLPPSLAGRWPRLEERLSRGALPCGGILGLALPALLAGQGAGMARSRPPAR